MNIGFFGADKEVTGSCHLIAVGDKRILVDCGAFQDKQYCSYRNYEEFGFNPETIDVVLVTHAHFDHIGRLPRLINQKGRPTIYSTAPTRDLAELILEDSHTIMLQEAEECGLEQMYSDEDIEVVFSDWKTVPYRESIEILPGVKVTWHDAGHILGSAFLIIEADGKRVAFSGDVGSESVPILHDTEALPRKLDLLVCESTYGDRLHKTPTDRIDLLREALARNNKHNGVLMIPAFSIERVQEVLFEMNILVDHENMNSGRVFLDSPLGISITAVYRKYQTELDLDIPEGFVDSDFFGFNGLHITDTVQESKSINSAGQPKVIIAGAGMMNAGRIQHHLVRYLDDSNNTLLVIGYQATNTLGRKILNGESPVEIFDYLVDVKAHIQKIESYSGHADYNKLTKWVKDCGVARVFLVHGDETAQIAFKEHLATHNIDNVEIPSFGDWIEV